MRKISYVKPMVVAALGGLLATGCVVRERVAYREPAPVATVDVGGEVYADSAPPPAIVETETVSPGVGFVWIGGGWVWGGGHWHWNRGYWGRPPHPGMVWVPHRYAYRGGRHVYIRGGWR